MDEVRGDEIGEVDGKNGGERGSGGKGRVGEGGKGIDFVGNEVYLILFAESEEGDEGFFGVAST